MNGEIRIEGDREHKLEVVSPGIYQIDLKKGEVVLLYPLARRSLGPGDGKQGTGDGQKNLTHLQRLLVFKDSSEAGPRTRMQDAG